MAPASPARYIYILGMGHSGSTLLELLLGAHPQLAPLGEIDKLSLQFARGDRPCSCRAYPTECPMWIAVADAIKAHYGITLQTQPFKFRVSDIGREEDHGYRAIRHWLLHKNSRLWRYMTYRKIPIMHHLAAFHRSHHRWIDQRRFVADFIRQYHGASGVIDSSKDYLGARDLAVAMRDELKIIFITREVYGSVWSAIKHNAQRQPEKAAYEWVKVNTRSLQMLQPLPQTDWLHLKYEELCNDLEATLKRLCQFLGYHFDPIMCDLSQHDYHTIGGNQIRTKAIGNIQADLSWKQHLSTADVQAINKIAANLYSPLGYC